MGIPLRESHHDVCGVPGDKVKAVIPGSRRAARRRRHRWVRRPHPLITRIKPVMVKRAGLQAVAGQNLRTIASSGGVVVMDADTDVVAVCAIIRFYAHESCGQVHRYRRKGTGWLARVCNGKQRGPGRRSRSPVVDLLRHCQQTPSARSGEAAAWPMLRLSDWYRGEFEAKLLGQQKRRKRTWEHP